MLAVASVANSAARMGYAAIVLCYQSPSESTLQAMPAIAATRARVLTVL